MPILGHRDHGHIVEQGQQDDVQRVQGAVEHIDQNASVASLQLKADQSHGHVAENM